MKVKSSLPEGIWRPSPDQELLLRAALYEDDRAIAAWEEWSGRVQLKGLDGGSQRLLPLVYVNLLARGAPQANLQKLRDKYLESWARNQIMFRRGGKALAALEAKGIPTLLLKASALIPLYYKDVGARPTSDLDVLVPPARCREALEILDQVGFRTVDRKLEKMDNSYVSRHYAHTLASADGTHLDLHQHVFFFETRRKGDDEFWSESIPVTLDGMSSRALCAADQLLHVCVHGIAWNPTPPIRWVSDAVLTARNGGVDWDYLHRQALAHEQSLAMRATLGYLAEHFEIPVPASLLAALEQHSPSRLERVHYEIVVRPPSEHNAALKLWYHYNKFRRLNEIYRDENVLLRFPAYLRDTWMLATMRDVPAYMLRFSSERLFRRFKPAPQNIPEDGS
jgi:hypothetical protein